MWSSSLCQKLHLSHRCVYLHCFVRRFSFSCHLWKSGSLYLGSLQNSYNRIYWVLIRKYCLALHALHLESFPFYPWSALFFYFWQRGQRRAWCYRKTNSHTGLDLVVAHLSHQANYCMFLMLLNQKLLVLLLKIQLMFYPPWSCWDFCKSKSYWDY